MVHKVKQSTHTTEVVTKEGEVKITLELNINVNSTSTTVGVVASAEVDAEEEETKWAIPNFGKKSKVKFGKSVKEE